MPSDSDSTPIPTHVGTANSVHFAESPIIINPSFDNSFAALSMNDKDSVNDDDGIVLDHVGMLDSELGITSLTRGTGSFYSDEFLHCKVLLVVLPLTP